jgi:hypothetical protein
MFKRSFFFLISSTLPLFAATTIESDEESLYLRRIYTLWEDKDYIFAKRQIEDFCQKFPQSPLIERFTSMLGDIALYEKEYDQALKLYDKVQDEGLKKTLSAKKWHALYQLKRYSELQVEIPLDLIEKSEEAKFYYAESLFREGCAPTLQAKEARPLWLEALGLYGDLLDSPTFSENAKIATAEIYRLLGEPKQAAKYYLELADIFKNKDGIRQEEVLFHASVALKEYDEEKAISIASHLAQSGVKRRKEGANLWFYLLVKTKRFEELLANEELFMSTLPDEKKGLYHYFLGKNYSANNDPVNGCSHLEKCIAFNLPLPYLKEGIVSYIECARKNKDISALEKGVAAFKARFNELEKESAHIDMILSQSYHEDKKSDKAIQLLDQIIARDPHNLMAYLSKAKILLEMRKIAEAHAISRTLLQLYPDKREVVRFSVNLALEHLSEQADEQLIEEIERTLDLPNIFSKEEKQNLRLFIAKSHLALKNTQKSIPLLKALCDENFEPSQTHFLLAVALFSDKKELLSAIEHGEKALMLDNSTFERRKLHLHLFNAYLELAKENASAELKENAANHLFLVINEMPISLENRLWLANHFVKKCEITFDEKEAQKAISILEPLFLEDEDFSRFESHALTLASLYEITCDFTKEQNLISKLQKLQEKNPSFNWRLTSEVRLKMADICAFLGQSEKAFTSYQELENDPHPFVSTSARLKCARLFFASLDPASKNQDNPHVQYYLRTLKELKQKRSLQLEPLHLEAAIDYAEVVAMLQTPNAYKKVLLEQLCKIKEEFLSKDDISSQDYHLSFEMLPQKAHVFASYMRYLDARIYQLQSHFCKESGDEREGNTKERAALALFSSLKQGKYSVTRYIKEKSTVAMK